MTDTNIAADDTATDKPAMRYIKFTRQDCLASIERHYKVECEIARRELLGEPTDDGAKALDDARSIMRGLLKHFVVPSEDIVALKVNFLETWLMRMELEHARLSGVDPADTLDSEIAAAEDPSAKLAHLIERIEATHAMAVERLEVLTGKPYDPDAADAAETPVDSSVPAESSG